jgi:hypothetical protein
LYGSSVLYTRIAWNPLNTPVVLLTSTATYTLNQRASAVDLWNTSFAFSVVGQLI